MEDPFVNIKNWFKYQPILSKYYLLIQLSLTTVITLNLISSTSLAFFQSSISDLQIYRPFTAMFTLSPLLKIQLPPVQLTFSSITGCIIAGTSQFLGQLITGRIFVAPIKIHLIYLTISYSETFLSRFYPITEGIKIILVLWFSQILYSVFIAQNPVFIDSFIVGLLYIWSKRFPRQKVDCLMFGSLQSSTFFYFVLSIMMIFNHQIKVYLFIWVISAVYAIASEQGLIFWLKNLYRNVKYIVFGE